MKEANRKRRTQAAFLWGGIASLYGIWLAAMGLMIALPVDESASGGALAITGLWETHQDARSFESVVLHQLRR